jgi:hypothetical protein
MIGNQTDAALAWTGPYCHLLSDEGSSRIVYLINDVVYKVNRHASYDDNLSEWENYRFLTENLPRGLFLPEMSLYQINDQNVIAAEYIDGDYTGECIDVGFGCECDSPCIDITTIEQLASLGIQDMSWGNAINYDGVVYLVDIAC